MHFTKISVVHVCFLLSQASMRSTVLWRDQNEVIFVQIALIFSINFGFFSLPGSITVSFFLFNRDGFWKASLKIRSRHGCCNHLAFFLGMLVSSTRFVCDCIQEERLEGFVPKNPPWIQYQCWRQSHQTAECFSRVQSHLEAWGNLGDLKPCLSHPFLLPHQSSVNSRPCTKCLSEQLQVALLLTSLSKNQLLSSD